MVLTISAEKDVRRLDVTMHQTVRLCFGQGVADLTKHEDRALRRQRPEPLDQPVGIEAFEQLHHVVECAVLRDAEVEEIHRMRRTKPGNDLGFALEPSARVVRDDRASVSGGDARMSLIAAGRASIRCRARHTSPMPPCPSFSSSR